MISIDELTSVELQLVAHLASHGLSCEIQKSRIVFKDIPMSILLTNRFEVLFRVTYHRSLAHRQERFVHEVFNWYHSFKLAEKGYRCYYDTWEGLFVYSSSKYYPSYQALFFENICKHIQAFQNLCNVLQPYVDYLIDNEMHCLEDIDVNVLNALISLPTSTNYFNAERLWDAQQEAAKMLDSFNHAQQYVYIPSPPTVIMNTNAGELTCSFNCCRTHIGVSMNLQLNKKPSDLALVYWFVNDLNTINATKEYTKITYYYEENTMSLHMDMLEGATTQDDAGADPWTLAGNFIDMLDVKKIRKITGFLETV